MNHSSFHSRELDCENCFDHNITCHFCSPLVVEAAKTVLVSDRPQTDLQIYFFAIFFKNLLLYLHRKCAPKKVDLLRNPLQGTWRTCHGQKTCVRRINTPSSLPGSALPGSNRLLRTGGFVFKLVSVHWGVFGSEGQWPFRSRSENIAPT